MLPRVFGLIGSDRYLTSAEVEQAAQPHPLTALAWDVYATHFQAFTGSSIDPLFHGLSHPATCYGSVHLEAGTGVLVVGTGPSLATNVAAVKALAGRVRIFTSPRGAEVLLSHGITPDLVLVEHQTALDAHHSARHVDDCARAVLPACPLVAADWRTPAALLDGVPDRSLFVPSPLATWGLWPATAVALAIEAGASRVALLGIDLGTASQPDPAHAPLAAVLGLLARLSPVVALDCGAGGATKRGWIKAAAGDAAGVKVRGACTLHVHTAPSPRQRTAAASEALEGLRPVVERARSLLALACEVRSAGTRARVPALEAGIGEMMGWRDDVAARIALQECLGVAFLPRLWRIGVDLSIGPALWRPLMLATHELVTQAVALHGTIREARAA